MLLDLRWAEDYLLELFKEKFDVLDPGFSRDLLESLADAVWRKREEETLLLLVGGL